MNTTNLTKGLFVALLLASTVAGAETLQQGNFEPKIIYQDTDYIARTKQSSASSAASSASTSQTQSSQSAAPAASSTVQVAEKSPSKSDDLLSQNYWLGLVVVGLAVLIFLNRGSATAAAKEFKSAVVEPVKGGNGETGVAKYMKAQGITAATAAVTGVAKYIKSLEATTKSTAAITGVTKYLKELETSAKTTVATTGVAKYLKNLDTSAR